MSENSTIIHLSDENFETEVATGVTLVDFYADWCGPCRMQAPVLEQVATEMQGKVKIGKVDTDHCPQVAALFQITSIPTLILLKEGKEVKRVVGVRDADALKALIQSAL